jgi:ABC-type bacteriocin/lantibiotic exporter with double-glycine peptidase domain
VSAVNVIKSVGSQGAVADEVQGIIDRIAAVNTRRGRLDAWGQSLSATGALVSLGAVGFWGIRCHLGGSLTQGDLLAAVWLTLLLRGPVTRLTGANVVHQRARVAVERIGALLERAGEPGWSPELPPYPGPGRTIKLRRLAYKDATRNWVMRDLNATIEGPALVCVTDDTGRAGSILFELLLRLRRPHKGRIYFDGHDARSVRVSDIRQRIGWVDRERHVVDVVAMFLQRNGNTLDDPRFAAAWASTQTIAPGAALEVDHRTRRADVARDVRLRLALTCALLDDPPMLLLDDPTSQLTEAGTGGLLDWLRQASRTRLVIVATNDPRIVPAATQTIHLQHTTREPASGNGAASPQTIEGIPSVSLSV